MILKTIIRLLGIVAIGLMMGSSINYAVKGYGLLGASGSWARLIAQSIASSSSSSQNPECPPGVDATKYTCRAREEWKIFTESIVTDKNGNGSTKYNGFTLNVTGPSNSIVNVNIVVPDCAKSPGDVCAKSFVTTNPPKIVN